jgi:DNA-binding NtrC family response regulator
LSALLVVDDDPQMLDILCMMLQRGHRVVRANSAAQALSVLDGATPVDLLLTDVAMPGVNGFNLAQLARRRRPRLKVLYLSGVANSADVMRDPTERYGKLLNKAISALDLIMEVDRALAS